MRVQFLGLENPLEDGMATHSCLENPMDREAWLAAVRGFARVRHNSATEQRELNKVFTGSRWQEKGLNEVCRDHGLKTKAQ